MRFSLSHTRSFQWIIIMLTGLLICPLIADHHNRDVTGFVGIWMGISEDDGSFFKVAITDNDGDGVAEVIFHDTFWGICTETNGLQGLESTLVPALVTGNGTVDENYNLNAELTIQCRDERNQDLGGLLGPLPVSFVSVSKNQLLLTTGMFNPSPLFRISARERKGDRPKPESVRDLIGFWMGVSYDDGSFFKVAITDNNNDGVAEVLFHDTFWSICSEANNLQGLEATLVPALVSGTGTFGNGSLNIDLTLQCRDEQNQDLGGPLGPLPVSLIVKSIHHLELMTGMFDSSPLFRVGVAERPDNGSQGHKAPLGATSFGEKETLFSLSALPQETTLKSNFPNPFNPLTRIRYDLKEAIHVQIQVFDMLGRSVVTLVDEVQPAGEQSVVWDGRNHAGEEVASGTYFYKMTAGNASDVQRMVLSR